MLIRLLRPLGAALVSGALATASTLDAQAAQFAAAVVNYTPGAAAGLGYDNPTAALGSPDGLTGEGFGFPNVLSPFSPAFESDELVQIGEGGSLTLRLSHFVQPTSGLELGVFSNAGIADEDFPNGAAGNPPFIFGGGAAVVEVSADGVTWSSLGAQTFNLPANYYLDSGPFDTTPGTVVADFGKPFAGALNDFSGLNHAQILALLDGSAGGTWLDISSTGLPQVGYIRFSLPDDGNSSTNPLFALDAVSLATAALGSPVPEPSTWLLLASGGGIWALARRRAPRTR
ncbi:MAG: PEP-CTERM sorting domain-containing protein [Planctomycetaceae bacterium]|nr:PEP-CTERM sorting domain-containing protein [Planctomycetaceae bacterium]